MANNAIMPVVRTAAGQMTSDGAGVRLRRVIGSQSLMSLDPFMLFDEFKSDVPGDYIAGFPNHPHRGFETVTYLIAGAVEHWDSAGNCGVLKPGGAQWMTAGRGVVHSEMPKQKDGLLWGFQLWVNLPAKNKMMAPRYQDINPADIPQVSLEGGATARVLAGTAFGAKGPVEGIVTSPIYLDLSLPKDVSVPIPIPGGKTAFFYIIEGTAVVDGGELSAGILAQLGPGDMAQITGGGAGGRAILVAAEPINEPVARWGPFVMNSEEEIEQAILDFREGRIKD
jgi:hypothetical protein